MRSVRLIPSTCAIPLDPSFMLVVRTWCHVFELSKITGTVLDMKSRSYRESIAQELAAHLKRKLLTSLNKKMHMFVDTAKNSKQKKCTFYNQIFWQFLKCLMFPNSVYVLDIKHYLIYFEAMIQHHKNPKDDILA